MKIDGNDVGANEVREFSSGKIVWNFINAEGKAITAGYMLGSIIAPDSDVKLTDNFKRYRHCQNSVKLCRNAQG